MRPGVADGSRIGGSLLSRRALIDGLDGTEWLTRAGATLRPGLSVTVKVDLKSDGGLSFAEAAAGTVQTADVSGARGQ